MAQGMLDEAMLGDLAAILDDFDNLTAIVNSSECVGVGLSGLGRRIATKLGLEQDRVGKLLTALIRLRRFAERQGSPADAIEWIAEVISERTPSEWQLAYGNKWRQHSTDLHSILEHMGGDHPISIAIKAQTLAYTHQNIFLNARLITDVRPVFSDGGTSVEEFVITHVLAIDYTDGTQNNTVLTLAMDQEDVAQLQRQCERAAVKVLTLQKSLASFPIVVMPDNSEDTP